MSVKASKLTRQSLTLLDLPFTEWVCRTTRSLPGWSWPCCRDAPPGGS